MTLLCAWLSENIGKIRFLPRNLELPAGPAFL